MRYIPEYYAITKDEYLQSQKLEGKSINPGTVLLLDLATIACEEYKKEVIAAIKSAYDKHIADFSGAGCVYSKTWGK